jgi:hypothetical protein
MVRDREGGTDPECLERILELGISVRHGFDKVLVSNSLCDSLCLKISIPVLLFGIVSDSHSPGPQLLVEGPW